MNTASSDAARHGGRPFLAAALRDSRSRILALLDAYAVALGDSTPVPYSPQINPPRWEAGHVGWFQDYWIARNRQRAQGIACDPDHERPAGRLPHADALYDSSRVAHTTRWQLDLPDLAATRAYLAEGLAETLALLAASPETDEALYFFRLALFHEDMHGEAGIYTAQALDIPLPESLLVPADAVLTEARPLAFAASNWMLGWVGTGFAFDNELAAREVTLPAFEIDSEAVGWRRYLPFVEQGGAAPPRYLRKQRWRLAAPRLRAVAGPGTRCPGHAPRLERRRCLVPLGRAPSAERSGVGDGGVDPAGISLGPRVGVDGKPLSALPRLRGPPVSRLFRTVVRRPLRIARCQPGHFATHGTSALP